MALFGRERELDLVARVLDTADAGPRVLVVTGEPGIGKSALLAAAAESAERRGRRTLLGRAAEHERSLPFALIADALAPAAEALGPARLAAAGPELESVLPAAGGGHARPSSAEDRAAQHRSVAALVGILARERPVALVLDDLHWADEASIETVLHLLRRPPDGPVALMLALRPGDGVAPLLDAARDHGEHLALGPLDVSASRALVLDAATGADAAMTERIVSEAAGHPLFARELARAAGAGYGGLPATLLAAVQQETSGLDDDARVLLWGAVVAGDPFDLPLAAAAADLPAGRAAPALDRVAGTGIVAAGVGGREFTLRHPLVRRAVYDAIPPGWRLAAHQRAAAALSERGAPAALRAYHVERFAHPPDDAAAALLEEAAAEVAGSSPATAAAWLEAAVRLLPQARDALLVPLARAQAGAGRPDAALAAYEAALADPGVPDRATLAVEAAQLERVLGRNADARRRLEAETDRAVGAERVTLEADLAATCFAMADIEGTLEHTRRVAEHHRGDEPAVAAIALSVEGFRRRYAGEPAGAGDLLDRAERIALELPDDEGLEVSAWVGLLTFQCERFATSAELLTRAVSRAERARREHILLQLRTNLAIAQFFDLRLSEALSQAERAEDAARLCGVPVQLGFATSTGAIVLDLIGRAADAERLARTSLEHLAGLEPSIITRIAAALDHVVLHEHDPERLLHEVLAALDDDRLRLLERPTTVLAPLVRAALATGRRAEAESWVARVSAFADRHALPAARVRADAAQALLDLAAGEPLAAAARLGTAVERCEEHTLRQDAVRTRILAGRALVDAGERERAAPLLEEALVRARRAGADRLAAEAARELRRAGLRVSAGARRAAGGDDELTERERAIAELVAAGRANKEVAAALHLSVKTVENNLSRIYAKLGVRSRTELARTLAPGAD